MLQVLQSNGCDGRWMLKSPGHALALDALTAVYPDAKLVVLHRDPVVLTASVCSLIGTMSGAFSDVDHRTTCATHWTQTLEDCIDRHRRSTPTGCTTCSTPSWSPTRSAPSSGSTATSGSTPGAGAFDAMGAELAARPQGVFGKHPYDLSTYGLDEAELRERFAGYIERYHVPHEATAGL